MLNKPWHSANERRAVWVGVPPLLIDNALVASPTMVSFQFHRVSRIQQDVALQCGNSTSFLTYGSGNLSREVSWDNRVTGIWVAYFLCVYLR
jgi:hypothetical protein